MHTHTRTNAQTQSRICIKIPLSPLHTAGAPPRGRPPPTTPPPPPPQKPSHTPNHPLLIPLPPSPTHTITTYTTTHKGKRRGERAVEHMYIDTNVHSSQGILTSKEEKEKRRKNIKNKQTTKRYSPSYVSSLTVLISDY